MLLSLVMPRMGVLMTAGTVERLTVAVGDALRPGTKLLDVRVDLSALYPQDCPPIYFFRGVAAERGWVRRLTASVGDLTEVGEVLALVSTDPNEPLDGPPARTFRVAVAGILGEPDWPAASGEGERR